MGSQVTSFCLSYKLAQRGAHWQLRTVNERLVGAYATGKHGSILRYVHKILFYSVLCKRATT